MSYELFEYRYHLNYRLNEQSMFTNLLLQKKVTLTEFFVCLENKNSSNSLEQNIRQIAASDYDIRLDWSAGLEIISLILSSFTLVTQILYLFSTYRNRIG
jgi:hypothetical protein